MHGKKMQRSHYIDRNVVELLNRCTVNSRFVD